MVLAGGPKRKMRSEGEAITTGVMNYFKNTVGASSPRDNRAFFAYEQLAATATMMLAFAAVFFMGDGAQQRVLREMRATLVAPHSAWSWALLSGFSEQFGIHTFTAIRAILGRSGCRCPSRDGGGVLVGLGSSSRR